MASTNFIAKLYRIALEVEDKSIQAKKSYGKYKEQIYNQKTTLICELIELCDLHNIPYGMQKSDNNLTSCIVFFELPNCEQISFHTTINNKKLPTYNKPWDGEINSTLPKILDAIVKTFPNIGDCC